MGTKVYKPPNFGLTQLWSWQPRSRHQWFARDRACRRHARKCDSIVNKSEGQAHHYAGEAEDQRGKRAALKPDHANHFRPQSFNT